MQNHGEILVFIYLFLFFILAVTSRGDTEALGKKGVLSIEHGKSTQTRFRYFIKISIGHLKEKT